MRTKGIAGATQGRLHLLANVAITHVLDNSPDISSQAFYALPLSALDLFLRLANTCMMLIRWPMNYPSFDI